MGRLSVERQATAGWTVIAVDLPGERLDQLAQTPGVFPSPCDVSDPEQVGALTAAVIERFGSVDRLVNAAGIAIPGAIVDVSAADFERITNVNYLGTVHWVRAVVPHMRAQRSGDLVLYASFAGFLPTPGMGAYVATKFALVGFTETLAMELYGTGIRIRVVCPSAVATPMLDGIFANGLLDGMRKLSRTTAPETVVDAVDASLRRRRQSAFVFPDLTTKVLWRVRRFAPGLLAYATRRISEYAQK
ncbi:hypothetical protein AU194_20240 [Mycobacterium sp. GA-2829]|nr:hypothetical protein AU194_20240 [Mycobacterium sp. GA-2829]